MRRRGEAETRQAPDPVARLSEHTWHRGCLLSAPGVGSQVITEPPNIYEAIEPYLPFIFAMWHGQHFLAPLVPLDRPNHRAKVLISRHRNAEINAIAAERLGIGTIRGSADQGMRFDRKGGVGAFVAMLDALKEGYTVAVTADVPKIPRVAGEGSYGLPRCPDGHL
jgi:lysophospholipid acyltransferase (LPLAT)-like uncharacterized protein